MKRLFLVLALLLFSTQAHATRYWVAKTGSDSNACAAIDGAADPGVYKLTIASGLTCLAASDTLTVKSGTYVESFTNPLPSGTSSSTPTTLEGLSGDTVTLRPTTGSNIILLNSARTNLTFRNLKIDAQALGLAGEKTGFRISETGTYSNLILEDLEVKNMHGPGIVLSTTTTACTLRRIHIHDSTGDDTTSGTGIYWRGTFCTGEDLLIHDIPINGISIYSSTTGATDNVIRNSRIYNTGTGASPPQETAGGINIYRSRNTVYNNIIGPNTDKGIRVEGTANTSKVYNNTIYGSGLQGINCASGLTGLAIVNNISLGNTGSNISALCTGTTTNLTTGTVADVFIDAAGGNFSLKESSAAIDTGTVISGFSAGRYVGSLPDIGALESCIRNKAAVENDEPTHYHIAYDCPIQSSRNNLTLQTPTAGNWVIAVAGVNKTLGNGGIVSATINGQSAVEVVLATAVTNGQSLTDAMTRSAAPTLTDSVCIGDPNTTCYNAVVRTHAASSGTNNVGAAPSHVVVQSRFRFHKLRGAEDAAVVQCATCTENVPITLPPGAAFRLRVKFRSDDNVGALYVLRYAIDTGGGFGAYTLTPDAMGADNISWYGITSDTDIPAAGTPTTELLTSDEASNTACAVVRTSSDYPTIILNNQETECEYILKISTSAAVGTKYRFQVWGSGGTPLDTYINTPELTVGSYTMMES